MPVGNDIQLINEECCQESEAAFGKSFARVSKFLIKRTVQLSAKPFKKGCHITRMYMYDRLKDILGRQPIRGPILDVSDSAALARLLVGEELTIRKISYPAYDLLNLSLPDNFFGAVVADQVLEHVNGLPQEAIAEVFRVLRPGGLAVFTTCLLYPVHPEPKDCFRFTKDGLAILFKNFSAVFEIGSWGNRYVWLIEALGLMKEGVPLCKFHPWNYLARLNDPAWPIHTWIIAQK